MMLETVTLLKSQKNEVFEILRQAGLETANFSWTKKDLRPEVGRIALLLNYLDGKWYFRFDIHERKHFCLFSPGEGTIDQSEIPSSWHEQKACLALWTRCLKREIETPDLWQKMEKYRPTVSLALPEQPLNESIPAYEAEQIADKLQQLAGKIEQQFELNDEQNKFVRNKLNYLTEAAKRQRSMDWVHTSIGVFVTIAMALELLPDKVKEFWQLVQSLFGEFIHLLGS